jgi:quercetin dioxygenase-like cupin family protein
MLKTIAVVISLVLGSAASLRAQDVAVVNPKTIRIKLDNAHVRVLEATIKPGYKEKQHSHPASIVYVLSGGKSRNHLPDGTTSEATYTAGQTIYREPVTHWAENTGKTTLHLIIVELKPGG